MTRPRHIFHCALFLAACATIARAGDDPPPDEPLPAAPRGSWVQENILAPVDPFELVPGKPASDWAFSLSPYGWLPGLHTSTTLNEFPRLTARLGPIDVLAKLDWGVFLRAEVRKGRWGVLADGMFARFSVDSDPSGPLYRSASSKIQQSIDSLALSFRVIDSRRGFLDLYAGGRYYYLGLDASANPDRAGIARVAAAGSDRIADRIVERATELIRENAGIAAEALAQRMRSEVSSRVLERIADNPPEVDDLIGLKERLEAFDPDSEAMREYVRAVAAQKVAEANGVATDAARERVANAKKKLADSIAKEIEERLPRSVSRNQSWIDPVIGLRAQVDLTNWLYLAAQADVGGFGVGSDIAWFVQAALGANITRNTSFELGYRYMYFDYRTNAFSMRSSMPGVYSGLVFRF